MLGEIFALLTALVFGFSAFIDKKVAETYGPLPGMALRIILASFAWLIILLFCKKNPLQLIKKDPVSLILVALLPATLGYLFMYLAYSKTTAVKASILTATYPFFTILAGVLFFKTPVTWKTVIGAILIFLGTILVLV